jgi:hypothetical protein
MSLENEIIQVQKTGVIEGIYENLTWIVLEIDLTNNNADEHSDYIRKVEKEFNKMGYKMRLYEDKNKKGLYHLHFVKPKGE